MFVSKNKFRFFEVKCWLKIENFLIWDYFSSNFAKSFCLCKSYDFLSRTGWNLKIRKYPFNPVRFEISEPQVWKRKYEWFSGMVCIMYYYFTINAIFEKASVRITKGTWHLLWKIYRSLIEASRGTLGQ